MLLLTGEVCAAAGAGGPHAGPGRAGAGGPLHRQLHLLLHRLRQARARLRPQDLLILGLHPRQEEGRQGRVVSREINAASLGRREFGIMGGKGEGWSGRGWGILGWVGRVGWGQDPLE